jgi:predicted MFS family arabinose efflux permease
MEGFKYVKSNPLIRNILILIAIIGAFSCEMPTIIPLLAKFTFGGDVETYTFLTTILGIGSMLGGFFAASCKRATPHTIINISLLLALSMFLVALSPSVMIAAIFLAITGGIAIFLVSMVSATLQLESAPEMRGRVMSLYTVAYFGTVAIGAPVVGWICQVAGARWGLAFGGFSAIIAAIIAFPTLKNRGRASILFNLGKWCKITK